MHAVSHTAAQEHLSYSKHRGGALFTGLAGGRTQDRKYTFTLMQVKKKLFLIRDRNKASAKKKFWLEFLKH